MSKIGPFAEPIPKDVLQKVAEIARKIEILEIRMVEANASMSGVPSPASAEFSAEHKVLSAEKDSDILTVHLRFALKVTSSDEASKGEALFSSVFRLLYSSNEMSAMPDDAISHFANTNSVHNAWPYWRELVQNMAGRMALPLLTLPLLRIQPPAKAETKPSADQK